MQSLCGNSFGCLSHIDGAIGEDLDWNGVHSCSRCMGRAFAILQFMIGEPIEWVVNEWVPQSKVMEKLESMILWHALQPAVRRLSDAK